MSQPIRAEGGYTERVEHTSPTRATLLVTSLALGGVLAGAMIGVAAVARAQDPYAHLDLFARVLTTIERDYVDDISAGDLVNAAIDGMVRRLDRQSRWLSSTQLEELQDQAEGATISVGVELAPASDGVTVVRVLPGSPALRDGLAPGDRILELDGKPLAGLDVSAVRTALEGPRGKEAVLTVIRPGWETPQTIETRRDKIHVPNATGALVQGVAYLRLRQFHEGAAFELEQELNRLIAEAGGIANVPGLVLDLRDNPGGLLTEAVAVADLFLADGLIVSTRGRSGGEEGEVHQARAGGVAESVPVVVLINGMSASASEIVAAALQERGRATLIGERTWGKGTVQQVYRHGDTALKLTVGRYYTPSGQPVADREGRPPDQQVRQPVVPTARDALVARLAALELAEEERAEITALLEALPVEEPHYAPIPWDMAPAERGPADPPLQAALEALVPAPVEADGG